MGDGAPYQTGLFALKLDDFPDDDLMPTLARATCQVDLYDQVLIAFEIIIAYGTGADEYGFFQCLFLRHDRLHDKLELILTDPGNEDMLLHEWNASGFYASDAADATPGEGVAQAAFAEICEMVSDAVHIKPLTEADRVRLNRLKTDGQWTVDSLIAAYGLHNFPSSGA
jgi:hypothetical protein